MVIFESRNDICRDVIKDVIDVLIRFLPTNQQEGGAGLQQPWNCANKDRSIWCAQGLAQEHVNFQEWNQGYVL